MLYSLAGGQVRSLNLSLQNGRTCLYKYNFLSALSPPELKMFGMLVNTRRSFRFTFGFINEILSPSAVRETLTNITPGTEVNRKW